MRTPFLNYILGIKVAILNTNNVKFIFKWASNWIGKLVGKYVGTMNQSYIIIIHDEWFLVISKNLLHVKDCLTNLILPHHSCQG